MTKIAWVLKLVRETDPVPVTYLKKLVNTDDIWEIRVNAGREWVILTNSFHKKTQKTPSKEIKLAEQRKKDYLNRR